MTTYQKESLTSLYRAMDYLKSYELPHSQVSSAIGDLERKIRLSEIKRNPLGTHFA